MFLNLMNLDLINGGRHFGQDFTSFGAKRFHFVWC